MAGQRLLLAPWVAWVALLGGMAVSAVTQVADAQTVVWKRCSNCNQDVSVTSQVGQHCPHCGAYWGSEQAQYVPGGGVSCGPTVIILPRPRNSLERMALYQAIVQQQLIQQQMLREQMIQEQRQLQREKVAQRCRKEREKEAAELEKLCEANRQKMDLDRQRNNPSAQAERHLAAATRAKSDGNLNAAVAYYRLVARALPGTPAAYQASDALARLGVP